MAIHLHDILTAQTMCLKLMGIIAALHSAFVHIRVMRTVPFSVYVYVLFISAPIELNAFYNARRRMPMPILLREKMCVVEHLVNGVVCTIAGWVLLVDFFIGFDTSLVFGGVTTIIAGCLAFINAFLALTRLHERHVMMMTT